MFNFKVNKRRTIVVDSDASPMKRLVKKVSTQILSLPEIFPGAVCAVRFRKLRSLFQFLFYVACDHSIVMLLRSIRFSKIKRTTTTSHIMYRVTLTLFKRVIN